MFARDLHDVLEARNLTDIFDVVFVSDHGMTDTSDPEWIYVDDILGDGFSMIEHEDGASPSPVTPHVALSLTLVAQAGRPWGCASSPRPTPRSTCACF